MDFDDKKLIQNFLAGDEAAFALLVKKYLPPTYNFLHHLVNDRAVLDDLTQETFVKVWKHLGRFDQSKQFKTWLFTIAKRTAYDYLKKKKSIPFSVFTDEDGDNYLDQVADNELLPDALWENQELAENLDSKLQQVPERYRTILLLCYKDDLSLSEVAKILGRPYNTIKSQHQRALAAFRRVLLQ